jgi:hypothetical protein
MYADLLIKNGKKDFVNSKLVPLIKFDLDWVLKNWKQNGCDLWEEVRSTDFFWNRAGYVYSLNLCQDLFAKLGDVIFASKCRSVSSDIKSTLDGHWTGIYIT